VFQTKGVRHVAAYVAYEFSSQLYAPCSQLLLLNILAGESPFFASAGDIISKQTRQQKAAIRSCSVLKMSFSSPAMRPELVIYIGKVSKTHTCSPAFFGGGKFSVGVAVMSSQLNEQDDRVPT